VVQPDGSTAIYFYYKDDKRRQRTEGWADAAFNFVPQVQVKAGSALFICAKRPQGGFSLEYPGGVRQLKIANSTQR